MHNTWETCVKCTWQICAKQRSVAGEFLCFVGLICFGVRSHLGSNRRTRARCDSVPPVVQVGCPFKVGIYWRSGTLTPAVTQVGFSCTRHIVSFSGENVGGQRR